MMAAAVATTTTTTTNEIHTLARTKTDRLRRRSNTSPELAVVATDMSAPITTRTGKESNHMMYHLDTTKNLGAAGPAMRRTSSAASMMMGPSYKSSSSSPSSPTVASPTVAARRNQQQTQHLVSLGIVVYASIALWLLLVVADAVAAASTATQAMPISRMQHNYQKLSSGINNNNNNNFDFLMGRSTS